MKKLYLLFLSGLVFCTQGYAQQDPLYAQYINNPLVINPAYTGINNVLNASLSYRKQWSGFDEAPSTTAFTAHTSLVDNKIGGGVMLVRDQVGSTINTQFNATYAYKIDFGDKVVSFGLQTGVLNLKEDNNELNPRDTDDPVFAGEQTVTKFNFGAGIAIKGEDFYLGLSVPRLVNSQAEFEQLEAQVYQRHFYFAAGYVYHFGTGLSLKAATLLRGVSGSPLSVDYNVNLILQDRFYAGILSRNFQTYGLLAQVNINENFRFGYVFEIPTDKSVGSNFNSHELTLTIDFAVLDFHFLNERYF
ncbi:type IX secretion system membrane protein PorP/SprF [Fulvivirga sp. M361]|uniref:PorP/SprF family type IX secretion system membrane protein n=1 Tax=Fulvivirga sp. M361 TaxID=2594266 RepID=UPI00117AD3FA|nr:type IX secretion system membrane protein PorP/SprF [Fulvivirga sp. M361]TRX60829.1 type IX secretion system membrane protein PorP/SprF [Fulvivirga sp. M361]